MFGLRIHGHREIIRRFSRLEDAVAKKALKKATLAGAKVIIKAAQAKVPIRRGKLHDHIVAEAVKAEPDHVEVRVGPDKEAFYGCILGGHTYVTTDKGTRQIASIKVGEKVLTQTGEFRAVTAVHRYPTVKGMVLVDIEVEYRRGRVHKLTLTPDHKVLVFRDGRNKWVPAKELLTSDMAYCRRKKSWSEGTARREERICEWCGATYFKGSYTTKGAVQGERFCSPQCRIAWNASMHRGRKRSEDTRARIRVAARKKLIEHPELHPSRIVAQRGHTTQTERVIAEWLNQRGLPYERQVPVGEHFVDFFLPDHQVIIEADGAYWHQDQAEDIKRDREIIARMPGVKIIHIHFYDERFSPDLDAQPLPNVFYVACNPGPDSFVDPETFVAKPILAVRHKEYVPPGRCPAKLYDLSVEGVHSFLASGILVSNSFLELGTSKMAARPFLRPALDENQDKVEQAIWDELDRAIRRAVQE